LTKKAKKQPPIFHLQKMESLASVFKSRFQYHLLKIAEKRSGFAEKHD